MEGQKKEKVLKTNNGAWLRLDNAGKLYPSIASSRVSTAFRLTAVLKVKVDALKLQQALSLTCEAYPFYNVKLRKGAFWYYFKKTDTIPKVVPESFFPCHSLDMLGSDRRPFKVLYYENRIHLEISHAISDGAGGMTFLKTLVKHYYEIDKKLEITQDAVDKAHEDEAFMRYYEPKIPIPDRPPRAYHFPFKLIEKGEYRITSGTYDTGAFKALAKKYNTSPTKMLLCLYFETIQEFILSTQGHKLSKTKPVIINMPVNLRNIFPSETMRNFFISITPEIDLKLGVYTREELLAYLEHYFGLTLTPKYLKKYISRNIRNELFYHVRLIPLFIKDFIMPIIYSYYGESLYTSSISNIGTVPIDEPYGDLISRLEVLPPPSEGNIVKATVIGYKDKTTISFGSLTDDRTIEREFFRKLRHEGINVHIETNYHFNTTGGKHGIL